MSAKHISLNKALDCVRNAAQSRDPVQGLTHSFYPYPARFSPSFAKACIRAFSQPGDTILDPYMGGGTTIVEALALGRKAVGCDINSLAVFVTRAKTTSLSRRDRRDVLTWAVEHVSNSRYSDRIRSGLAADNQAKNLSVPSARPLRKMIALALDGMPKLLRSANAERFARCVLLNVGQWSLNGRVRTPTAEDFRFRVVAATCAMIKGLDELSATLRTVDNAQRPVLVEMDSELIATRSRLRQSAPVDLVVTSPPYPGIHALYHRWQVDGRKETDAPYWIASCKDGSGESYYTFASRKSAVDDRYFEKAFRTFSAIRKVMRRNAVMVQLVAFSDPERQLRRYLRVLRRAGFDELRGNSGPRTRRDVPGRRWHANSMGQLASAREILLVHKAD